MHNEHANDALMRPMSHGRRYASIAERALLLWPLIFHISGRLIISTHSTKVETTANNWPYLKAGWPSREPSSYVRSITRNTTLETRSTSGWKPKRSTIWATSLTRFIHFLSSAPTVCRLHPSHFLVDFTPDQGRIMSNHFESKVTCNPVDQGIRHLHPPVESFKAKKELSCR